MTVHEDFFKLLPRLNQEQKESLQRAGDIHEDHRKLQAGDVFLARKGEVHDGHRFLQELPDFCPLAIVEKNHPLIRQLKRSYIEVENTTAFARQVAAPFYHYPSHKLDVHAVTGTNGKTTTTYFVEAILRAMGKNTGVLGTVEIRYGNKHLPANNTTPDALLLQKSLSEMLAAEVESLALEASSHALEEGRMTGTRIKSLAFSNLSPEHLDFHPDMQSYFAAKCKALDLMQTGSRCVAWLEDSWCKKFLALAKEKNMQCLSYGLNSEADLSLDVERVSLSAQSGKLTLPGGDTLPFVLEHIGRYNALNALTALALLLPVNGSSAEQKNFVETGLEAINKAGVPGRMERIENERGALVLVDYAHSSDALEKALKACQDMPHKKLRVLFGCGGDRDRTKRPAMGKVAATLADYTYLTSDNPRTEDPEIILDEIESSLKGVPYIRIGDRKKAIEQACADLETDDILLIAGKGHEDYQILGRKKIHFDDRKIARDAL